MPAIGRTAGWLRRDQRRVYEMCGICGRRRRREVRIKGRTHVRLHDELVGDPSIYELHILDLYIYLYIFIYIYIYQILLNVPNLPSSLDWSTPYLPRYPSPISASHRGYLVFTRKFREMTKLAMMSFLPRRGRPLRKYGVQPQPQARSSRNAHHSTAGMRRVVRLIGPSERKGLLGELALCTFLLEVRKGWAVGLQYHMHTYYELTQLQKQLH